MQIILLLLKNTGEMLLSIHCITNSFSVLMCLHSNELCSAATEVSGCQLVLIDIGADYIKLAFIM